MSAPAINPAPSPTPSANAPSGGAANGGQAQGEDPAAGFDTVLATLFGIPSPAGAPGGKTHAPGKPSGDPGKTKTAGGDQTATADATAAGTAAGTAVNPNLALLVPVTANLPSTLPPTPVEANADPAPAPGSAPAALVVAATAADGVARLAADAQAKSDAGAIALAATANTATPVASAAINAGATANAATAPKPDAAPAPSPLAAPTAAPAAAAQPEAPSSPAAASQAVQVTPPSVQAADAQPPTAPKERVQAIKASTRVDGVKTAAAPGGVAALTAKAADGLQPVAGEAPKGGFGDKPGEQPLTEAKIGEPGAAPAHSDPATSATTTPATLIHASAAAAVRGAPQTVANLAAQIVKKLEGRASLFNVQLDPVGLGKVDVRIAIGADGRMSAAMSFDTPQAAAELKARAAELQQAMAQAGFDLTGGLSFDVASDRGQGQGGQTQQQPDAGAAFRGRAFQAALDTTADTPPPQYALRRAALAGVDIRI